MKKLMIIALLLSNIYSYSQSFNYQVECQNAVTVLDRYWNDKMNKHHFQFTTPSKSFYSAQSPLQTGCGAVSEPNAAYCPADNSIYLSVDLFHSLSKRYQNNGLFFFILGHEYGHLVQWQTKYDIPLSMAKELHADCLAGVFFHDISSQGYTIEQSDINAVYSFLTDFNTVNAGWKNLTDPNAHGDGETRYKAFGVGYREGNVLTCNQTYVGDASLQQSVKSAVDIYNLFRKK